MEELTNLIELYYEIALSLFLIVIFIAALYFTGRLIFEYLNALFDFPDLDNSPSRCEMKYGKLVRRDTAHYHVASGRMILRTEFKRIKTKS